MSIAYDHPYMNFGVQIQLKIQDRELLTEHLSSHSARSGGAQDAQEHKDIQIQWVILRGKVIYYS